MCLNTQEYWRKSISKMAKNYKNRQFFHFKVAPKIHQNFVSIVFNKNSWKLIKRTGKNKRIGNFIIFEEIMSVQSCQNLKKIKKKYANVHKFIKTEIF
jgi:hypothetical protein